MLDETDQVFMSVCFGAMLVVLASVRGSVSHSRPSICDICSIRILLLWTSDSIGLDLWIFDIRSNMLLGLLDTVSL